ncbi:hypothetical protein GCM10010275_19500 [Streptomyces litmocidini]|uniref:hypothetical protein n=1 Tax=Streptomyces litmocidini TaxID=67318 RepID=UPI00167C45CD|nr:hypothetical protein [Streptomyces litmocidini]GGU84545.1 hypothetical protein GCM10010275_19500 [Streptomyces litmocidini]
MTVSLCHHSHIVLPPHGSIFHPSDCTRCGMTWDAIQTELRRQEEALIAGTARDGSCPNCSRQKRLYRFQPSDKPWTPIGYEEPVSFLCVDCWNDAAQADNDMFLVP